MVKICLYLERLRIYKLVLKKKLKKLMLCLEVWRESRVEGNDYPPHFFDVFKIT